MSETSGGAFPGGSYLQGAIPRPDQHAYAVPAEAKGPRDPAADPHDVFLGLDTSLSAKWECRSCREEEGQFATGQDAAESARRHAGPNGRVST